MTTTATAMVVLAISLHHHFFPRRYKKPNTVPVKLDTNGKPLQGRDYCAEEPVYQQNGLKENLQSL
jgi:hypothetical protein